MTYKKWTEEEIEYLKNNYETMSKEDFTIKFIDRTYDAVLLKASKLGLSKNNFWNDDNILKLKSFAMNGSSLEEIYCLFNNEVSKSNIRYIIKKNKIDISGFKWSKNEDNVLINNIGHLTNDEIKCLLPYRSELAIKNRCSALNLLQNNTAIWNNFDIDLLNNYAELNKPIKYIEEELNYKYNKSAIRYKLSILGYIYTNRWEKDEDNILIDNCNNKTFKELNLLLPHRSLDSVECRCSHLKLLTYIKDDRITWTQDDNNLLIEKYPFLRIEELKALFPNKSSESINSQALRLNIKKNIGLYNEIKKDNSHKSKTYWSEEKNEKLFNHLSTYGTIGIYELFPEHKKGAINKQILKFNTNILKIYDGIKFSSIEERNVYIFIKNFNINIDKCFRKNGYYFYNNKYDEHYIPDYVVNKNIIIEYYGWFLPSFKNKRILQYIEKTHRKNEYYKSNSDIYFIDLYPADIKNNFEGVRNKLTSFFMDNFSIDINKLNEGGVLK